MKASDFYFQLINDPSSDPSCFFLITPRLYYDSEGCLSDESGLADEVLPNKFVELAESTFEYNGPTEHGRQTLIDAGFVEINFGLDSVKPVENLEGEDDYEETEEEEEEDENDIDYLLKQDDVKSSHNLDYSNLPSSQLERHLKAMIQTESFLEAAKIKKELDSRTELNK